MDGVVVLTCREIVFAFRFPRVKPVLNACKAIELFVFDRCQRRHRRRRHRLCHLLCRFNFPLKLVVRFARQINQIIFIHEKR